MSNRRRLDMVRVPRPCAVSWESMGGTGQSRACSICDRRVYDLAEMATCEAEALLARGDERLCVRLSLAADGKVVTADRVPVYSARQRPLTGLSVAALAAFLGLSLPRVTIAASQPIAQERQSPDSQQTMRARGGTLAGRVLNDFGEGFPEALVIALSESNGREFTVHPEGDGRYRLALPQDTYLVSVECPGFPTYAVRGLRIASRRTSRVDATLRIPVLGEVVTIDSDQSPSHGSVGRMLTAPVRAIKRMFGR